MEETLVKSIVRAFRATSFQSLLMLFICFELLLRLHVGVLIKKIVRHLSGLLKTAGEMLLVICFRGRSITPHTKFAF